MLDAGSVFTTLGGEFNESAFLKFDAANKRSAATMQASEAKIEAAQARSAAARARHIKTVEAQAAQQIASDRRRASSAQAAAAQEAVSLKQSEIAARRSAGAWTLLDRAQLGLYGSTRRVAESQRRAKESAEAAGKAMRYGLAGGLIAFGYAAYKGVTAAADVEQQLNIFRETAQATDRQMEAVSRRAIQLGADMDLPAVSAADAADVMVQLAKGGFDVAQSMAAAKGTLQLAAAAGIDNAQAAEIQVDALRAFNLEADQAGRVADLLAAAASATSVEVPQIALALRQSAAVARQFNIPIEQTVAMIGQLANAGLKGSDAGTSLKTMLQSLIPNSARAASEMKRLGVDVFDAAGRMLPVPQIIDQYAGALRGLSQEQQAAALKTIFGSDAIRAATIILGRGVRAHQDMVRAVERDGAAADLSAARMRGAKGAAAALQNAWETLATTAGLELLPRLTQLGNEAARAITGFATDGGARELGQDLADGLDTALQVMGAIVATGGDVAAVLADIGGALNLGDADTLLAIAAGFAAFKVAGVVAPMVITLAAAINTLVLEARTAASVSMFASSVASMANPVTAIAAVLATAAAAFVYFKSSEQSAAEAAQATTNALTDQRAAVDALQDSVLAAADATFAARHAVDDLADARRRTADAARRYGKDSKQFRDAFDAENEAALRLTAAHQRLLREKRRIGDENRRTAKASREAAEAARAELEARVGDVIFGDGSKAEKAKAITDAFDTYSRRLQQVARNSAEAKLADVNLQRVLNGGRLIAGRYAESVAKLADVYKELPRRQQVQLATTAQPALAQIGDLVGALRDVPRQQVVNILARADSAQAQIGALRAVVNGVPAQKVIRVLAATENARTQLAAVRALAAGMPAQRVIRILADGAIPERAKIAAFTAATKGVPARAISKILADGALSEKQKVDALRASISALSSKTVTITTRQLTIHEQQFFNRIMTPQLGRRASGRPAGGSEAAIIGEGSRWQGAREAIVSRETGAGYIVDRPTLVGLRDDQYVIPLDEHRGPALDLMRLLARDLGIDRFDRGRRPRRARRHRRVPGKIDPLALPVDEIQQRVDDTRSKLESNRSKIQSLPGEIRNIEKRDASDGREKADKAKDLAAARRELVKARKDAATQKTALTNLQRSLREAKAYQARIDRQRDLANLAQQDMDLADRRDDDVAYGGARNRRLRALRELARLLGAAQRHVRVDSAYFRRIQADINQAQLDQLDLAADGGSLSASERDRLAGIEAGAALAELTDTRDDDLARGRELVDFWQRILDSALRDPAARGGNEGIKEIAESLQTARQNYATLTSTAGGSGDSDANARAEQAEARARAAEEDARISKAALAVLGGPGDIGAGGRNARDAAAGLVVNQTINTLHTGSPEVQLALAETAAAGFGLQAPIRSPRRSIL